MNVSVHIDTSKCDYCLECVKICHEDALWIDKDNVFHHDSKYCNYCECCYDVCTEDAVIITSEG